MDDKYDHSKVEKKWQEEWSKSKLYVGRLNDAKKPFYNLWMFPYPSAEGLHAGHAFASTGSDVYGRFMRMNEHDVFQPIGYDSFGIHSENYAIKIDENPSEVVKRTTKHYEEQMRSLGHGYDWTRTVTTSDQEYYKWTQWLFLKMWEAGLAYKKVASVNFCPSCKTVLADEQVIDGKCERCGSIVGKKDLEQWFFKITEYAGRLLEGLGKINWSKRVVTAQRNWIGKSEGMIVKFKTGGKDLEVFTTRPDTLNAATFLATSKLYEKDSNDKGIDNAGRSDKEKVGKFTGKYAVNPLNGNKIPIWDTNYVSPEYGTGVIMGVPAHDGRDMEFAKKYKIDILNEKPDQNLWGKIKKEGWGKRQTNYHLRDWLVSRQRYWGAPIPMVDCTKCGWQPVAEKDLPVLLPNISDYKPEGTGKGPLANHKEFFETKCPNCGGKAVRETDVMDTFVDSSWYFLRYPSVGFDKVPFDEKITKKWLPVNLYFGGAEHSVLHLMYARFVTMVLSDKGYLDFSEPFLKFFAHGLMIKDGAKMSKSKGNVVNPDEYVTKYGADTLRLYLMFMGPMDGSPDFRDEGIEGMEKFLNRVWKLFTSRKDKYEGVEVRNKLHQTIKNVTEDIEGYKFNTAISSLMELVNTIYEHGADKDTLKNLCLLLAPFAPHLSEELWVGVLGEPFSIHTALWPHYNAKFIDPNEVVIVIQVNGKVRGQLTVKKEESMSEKDMLELAKNEEKVKKWISGAGIKKEIFVPGKLVNFVVYD